MRDLYLAADAAYPFDYSRLPRRVKIFLGYVGSELGTPHVWSQAEIDRVRAAGRVWVPIWTPAADVLTEQLGRQAANEMIAALAGYHGLTGCPVFLDIEQHVYAADPAGAKDAWQAWQQVMHGHGHSQAWPYLPGYVGYGWAANWTGTRPKSLPAGLIGWQYQGHVDGDRYDLSVVRRRVFDPWIATQEGADMPLDAAAQKFIVDQLQAVQDTVLARLRGIYHDGWEGHPHPAALVHLRADLERLLDVAGAPGTPGPDPAALAEKIAAALGPDLAERLADELHRRLAT